MIYTKPLIVNLAMFFTVYYEHQKYEWLKYKICSKQIEIKGIWKKKRNASEERPPKYLIKIQCLHFTIDI